MNRIALAFRSFFAILFTGKLPVEVAQALGFTLTKTQPVAPKAAPQARPQDGAVQILGILQRDSRLIDFLMEDISAYSDEQVGAAVRSLHGQSRDSLEPISAPGAGDRWRGGQLYQDRLRTILRR